MQRVVAEAEAPPGRLQDRSNWILFAELMGESAEPEVAQTEPKAARPFAGRSGYKIRPSPDSMFRSFRSTFPPPLQLPKLQ